MTTRIVTDANGRKHITNEPLLHPPSKKWVGLTGWEREAIALECGAMSADWLVFVEAVERALKEKNT